jgi:hypothetical protein
MNQCIEGQPFARNYNPSYKANKLAGHTGQDCSCGFGSLIHSRYDGIAYKVLTPQNPSNDGAGFTGVFMIVDNGIECFEWLVGHCDPSVAAGIRVRAGDVIGTEANHGTVYVGNVLITLAMQKAGDERGAHRHYQKRPVMKVKRTDAAHTYLDCRSDNPPGQIYRDLDGNYYQIFAYSNGFHGCVDPSLPVFTRDLHLGSSGYDVFVLQRFLAAHGSFTAEPTGFFGSITEQAVAHYQKATAIEPVSGYFGPITRKHVLGSMQAVPDLSAL